jgi:hypothetical protein
MKKYITFDKIAYAMSLSIFIFIAVTLCAACVDLQKRTSPRNFTPEQINILDELEKPLCMNTSGYPIKTIRPKNHDNA